MKKRRPQRPPRPRRGSAGRRPDAVRPGPGESSGRATRDRAGLARPRPARRCGRTPRAARPPAARRRATPRASNLSVGSGRDPGGPCRARPEGRPAGAGGEELERVRGVTGPRRRNHPTTARRGRIWASLTPSWRGPRRRRRSVRQAPGTDALFSSGRRADRPRHARPEGRASRTIPAMVA